MMACDRFCDPNSEKQLTVSQFKEAFLQLIDEVSLETKQAVARAIAHTPHTPRLIVLYFAMEPVSISAPILVHSPILGQLDLLRIVESKKGEHAELISERTDLGRTVIERLYALKDASLDTKLTENATIATNHENKSAEKMFASIHGQLDMSAVIKKTEHAPVAEQTISKSASHSLLEAAARGKRLDTETTDGFEASKPDKVAKNQDIGEALEHAARLGSRHSVGVLLTKYLGLELNTAFQVLEDKSGDTLTVALKSQHVSAEQCNRIIMLTFPQVGLSVQNAKRSMNFYSSVSQAACEQAVSQWPKQSKAVHEKVLSDTKSDKTPRETATYRKESTPSNEYLQSQSG